MLKQDLVELASRIIAHLPRSYGIYAPLSRYVDRFAGDNNMDPETNGEYSILSKVIPQCDVVFDVGANEGQWTSRVKTANPTCEIHAFEPASMTFEILKKNVGDRGVRCCQLAMGDAIGTLPLLNRKRHTYLNSFYHARGEHIEAMATNTETVSVATLDSYCEKEGISKIDFLKADVEGHELAVLRGARRLLTNRAIQFIQFEYHATWIYARTFLKDVFDLLHPAGYNIYKMLGGPKLLHLGRYSQDLDTFRYSNYFVARDNISSRGIKIYDAKHMT
jgi:FkbM family methyltransferase